MMSAQFYITTIYLLLLATSSSAKMATRPAVSSSLFETASSFDDSTFSAGSFSQSKPLFDDIMPLLPASSSSGYVVSFLWNSVIFPTVQQVAVDYASNYFSGSNHQHSERAQFLEKVQFLKKELVDAQKLCANLVMGRTEAERSEMTASNKTHAEKYAEHALVLKEQEQEAMKRVQKLEQIVAEATGKLPFVDADDLK